MRVPNNTLERPVEKLVFLVYPQDVDYQYAKMLCTVQAGVTVSPHKHPNLTEAFRLLTDTPVSLVIDGKIQHLKPNDPIATAVPPGMVHAWVNDTNKPLTFEVCFYPRSGQTLQGINIIGAFMSYFSLENESQKIPARFVPKLIMSMKFAVSEYAFRNYCVSVSIVARMKVFLLAQAGHLLGLKLDLGES